MNDTPEIARIRDALYDYRSAGYFDQKAVSALQEACDPGPIQRVLAHIDAQAAKVSRLTSLLAECRDAVTAPTPGPSAEWAWGESMAGPEFVPAYVRAVFAAQAAEIERLLEDAERLRAAIKSAYEEGFYAPTTYNDSPTNDVEETWPESQAASNAAMKETP